MTATDRIELNPRVMLGKPVIRGTRIPAELVLRKLSEGASETDLIDAYPRLTRDDIQAAMRSAADRSRDMSAIERITMTPDVCGGRPSWSHP